jgi:hypothetical protein
MSLLLLTLVTSASALRVSDPKPPKVSLWESVFNWTKPSLRLPEKFKTFWEKEPQDYSKPAAALGPRSSIKAYGASQWFDGALGHDAIKLVVGVPMMTNQEEVLQAHLSTWVTGKGVCDINSYAKSECHIFPVFLYGDSPESKEKVKKLGAKGVSLPVPEPHADDDGYQHGGPINAARIQSGGSDSRPANPPDRAVAMRGKSYEWFKYASANFQWATHLSKMDADAFPHFGAILADLAAGPSKNLYWGAAMGDTLSCNRGFMQGAFYIESANLEPCRQKQVDADFPDYYKNGGWKTHEDGFFGESLYRAVNSSKCPQVTCMNVRAVKRYEHPV